LYGEIWQGNGEPERGGAAFFRKNPKTHPDTSKGINRFYHRTGSTEGTPLKENLPFTVKPAEGRVSPSFRTPQHASRFVEPAGMMLRVNVLCIFLFNESPAIVKSPWYLNFTFARMKCRNESGIFYSMTGTW
jgi:hypothetical protein